VSGRSAPEPSVANWEISFVPPLPVTYTNGAPAGDSAAAGAPATVHPAASPQAITAKTAAHPIRRPRLSQPRPGAAPNITAAPAAQTFASRQASFTAWLIQHPKTGLPGAP
jgi:hypothetical protein